MTHPSRWLLLGCVLAALVVVGLRLHFADLPLERDEGEYAYGGQLLLRGGVLYRDLYTLKLPGAHAVYAGFFLVAGESARTIRLGLLAVNLGTAALVLLLGRRLLGPLGGPVAATAFVLLSASLAVLGLFAHATQLLVLPLTGGLLALHAALHGERRSAGLALSGLLLGLALLIKQHAAVFVVFAAAMVLLDARRRRGEGWGRATSSAGLLLAGAALPLAVLVVAVVRAGVLDTFWFWCFRYARDYVSILPLDLGLKNGGLRLLSIAAASPLVIALALWGAARALRRGGDERRFLGGWVLAGLACAAPGLYFREHYFVPLLPALALLAGAGAAALPRRGQALLPALLVASALYPLWWEGAVLLERNPSVVMHRMLGSNPFPEAVEIARYLRREARPGDRLAVLGSEPEIPFLSDLPSATGYVYVYGLMEPQPHARAMQEDLIRRLEANPPRFIVYVGDPLSWLPWPDSDLTLIRWQAQWLPAHYDRVGLVEIVSRERTDYAWGREARRAPRTPSYVMVLRRRA